MKLNHNYDGKTRLRYWHPIVKANFKTIEEYANDTDQALLNHRNAATLDHPDGSVTTAKIADNAVTDEKIGTRTITNALTGNGSVMNKLTELLEHLSSAIRSKAPINHRSTDTTYGIGDGAHYGHVKLSDDTDNTAGASGGTAATPAAVKSVMDAVKTETTNRADGDRTLQEHIDTEAAERQKSDTQLQTNIDTLSDETFHVSGFDFANYNKNLDVIKSNGMYGVFAFANEAENLHYPAGETGGILIVYAGYPGVYQLFIPSYGGKIYLRSGEEKDVSLHGGSSLGEQTVFEFRKWELLEPLTEDNTVLQSLQGKITNEATARQTADEALQAALNVEKNTRSESDTALQEAIAAETSERKESDSMLSGLLDTLRGYVEKQVCGFVNEFVHLYTAIGVAIYDGGLFSMAYDGVSLDGGGFTDTDLVPLDCGGFEPIRITVETGAVVDGGDY